MSEYDNVVKGKLKLKGEEASVSSLRFVSINRLIGGYTMQSTKPIETENDNVGGAKGPATVSDGYLTPAERRFMEQWEKIDSQRLAKMADKSHRDRIHEFNQYLANLTQHYDIPKVGPG